MRLGWVVLALLLAAAIAIPVYLIVSGGDEEEPRLTGDVTVENIANNRGRYIGERVTLSGEVAEVITQKLFVLRGARPGDERVVVASSKSLASLGGREMPGEGDRVRLSGEVDAIDLAELRDRFGPLGGDAERVLRDQAFIRADSLTFTPSTPPPRAKADLTPADILDDPEKRLGELTTVDGRADDVYGPNAFTLGDLLVVTKLNEAAAVEKGDFVEVTGPVRRFDRRRLEREAGVDLPGELGRYAGKPVLWAKNLNYAVPPAHRESGVDPQSLE